MNAHFTANDVNTLLNKLLENIALLPFDRSSGTPKVDVRQVGDIHNRAGALVNQMGRLKELGASLEPQGFVVDLEVTTNLLAENGPSAALVIQGQVSKRLEDLIDFKRFQMHPRDGFTLVACA